jgi:hypothetical protein
MDTQLSERESPATYEISLQAAPPDSLTQHFEDMRVARSRPQTVLSRRVESQAELDCLLESLGSLGLSVAEVHEIPLPSTEVSTDQQDAWRTPRKYEVRVDGELGPTLLRFLHWRHSLVPEQTSVRLDATPTRVLQFLAKCSELGLGIQRVRRVEAGV